MRILAGTTAAAVLLSATGAVALGLDRSGQDITAAFEPANYAELSFGYVTPTLEGRSRALGPIPAQDIDDVGNAFSIVGAALTYRLQDDLTISFIVDEPYGADVLYPGSSTTTPLGGTAAELSSTAVTVVGRYRINDNVAVHTGYRNVRAEGSVTLSGLAYGGLSGYNVDLSEGSGVGYLIGVSYEKPEIALRVALTYASEVDLSFDTVERVGTTTVAAGDTTVVAPASWNLDFQTGIAADTLLFGTLRWAEYETTRVSPDFFAANTGGGSLTDIDTNWAMTLGVGRKITDQLSLSAAVGYEPGGEDDNVSPLAPSNGATSIQLGARYAVNDRIELSGGLRYTMLGDAVAAPGGTPVADFADNSATSIGMSVAYRF